VRCNHDPPRIRNPPTEAGKGEWDVSKDKRDFALRIENAAIKIVAIGIVIFGLWVWLNPPQKNDGQIEKTQERKSP
jgi:hypothetical protein